MDTMILIKHWKRLFIIFVLTFCAFLLPRVALNFFYYPDNHYYGYRPDIFERVEFTAKDGTHLTGWFIPSTKAPPLEANATVIHAHGNAGNMTAHWPLVSWLPERNFNVFMFDYRGFGDSEGKPTPEGLCDDTESAIDYVRQREDIDPERLVLLGQSLGGNNVIAAVGRGDRQGIKAIAIDSTFLSYSASANDAVPGIGFLLDDDYSAQRYIASLSPIPLLLLHGTDDHVIATYHTEKLFELAAEPKQKIIIPGGKHIDAFASRHGDTYRNKLVEFYLSALAH
ncbi:alpha/beta hydrolase [Superficieibacter sp. BNK-5]|uniref:alpha/beta hydrolase n=1 Tax=Superficieibacter sp. BNK-5 TaxID=3376142 RepID=UPI0039BF54E6